VIPSYFYLTMVRLHLKYASVVWNPSIHKQIKMIEDVEKFAMKVVTRRWDTGCQDRLNAPSLESRRLQSSMYKFVHGLCYFPPDIVSLRPSFCQRTDRQFLLHQSFACTNAFNSSFVPNATNLWNTLPERLVTSSFSTFKS